MHAVRVIERIASKADITTYSSERPLSDGDPVLRLDWQFNVDCYSGIMSKSRTACHVPAASRTTGRMAMKSGPARK